MDEGAPVTILFTDVEGSTDLRTRRGDDAAHEVLRRHEALVRGCVADHDGREVKALGDGFMIAFASARRALSCAVAIQQATEAHRRSRPEASVRVRIGVNTGEVLSEDDDLYGQAVNAAARVAGRAKGGEILVAEVTKQLVGSRPELTFTDRGRLRLKGFPERWRLFELAWSVPGYGAEAAAAAGGGRTPFVGREAERAELRGLLDGAVAGTGALVMIGGEPGVGKTRLAEELVAEAAGRGVEVLAGHSYEMEGAAPYVAVVEILEAALARAPSPGAWREFLGEEAAEITRLLPRLRQLCPDIPPPLELPAEQERRLLFNNVAEVMERSARQRPLLLLFDDLQWADDPTLLCLEHLAERVAEVPVLIVATYRDTEVDVGRPLAKTFEDLRRRHLARWLPIARLPEDGVAGMLRALSGREPPAGLVAAVYSEAEGNPFFVEEVYKYLAEEGRLFDAAGGFRTDLSIGELDVPAGVRLVVGRRLARLAAGTVAVLAAGAVAGRAFSVELLEAVDGFDPDAVLDAVEDAERARVITPAPDASGEDRFIFAHELIRQTLLAELSLTRRRRLHARLADARERHYGGALDAQAATIAHHLTEAGGGESHARAFGYLVRAGRFAMASAAFEEAVRHYERAHALDGTGEPAERAELLFELGTARASSGQLDSAVQAWLASLDAYEALGDAEAVGRVAASAALPLVQLLRAEEGVAICERGLAALGERVSAPRARLLATTATVLAWSGQYRPAREMVEDALGIAAQLADDALLGHALHMKAFVVWAHMEAREALQAGARAIELCRAAGDTWNLVSESGMTSYGLFLLGRWDELRANVDEFLPVAERIGHVIPFWQHTFMGGLRDFCSSGEITRLEAVAAADAEIMERSGLPYGNAWSWSGLARFLRGDWDEALRLYREATGREVPMALRGWHAMLLFECLAYRGERDEALALLAEFMLPQDDDPETWTWGAACMLSSAVEGLTVLGERDRAAALYRYVVEVCERTGAVTALFEDTRLLQRAAGIAALAGRNWDAAEEHFRTALRQAAELPHRIEEAHTRRWYGQMLLERNGPGDRQAAENVLAAAIEDYERMGIPRHRDLAAALLAGRRQ